MRVLTAPRAIFAASATALAAFILSTASAGAAGTGFVFVSNERSNNILVYDPANDHEIVANIATSRRPRDMKFNGEHTLLYVACGDDGLIEVIDVATLRTVDQIVIGGSPEMIAISTDGTTLYVSNEETSSLQIVSIADQTIIGEVPTGAEPEGVLLSENGTIVYVASEIADMVHAIDTEAGEINANIIVGNRPRRLAMTPDGTELWVSDELSGTVTITDPSTNLVLDRITFAPPGFRQVDVTPVGILASADGATMYVALGRANHVAFVDVDTRQVTGYALAGARAWELALSSDGRQLYVANGLSDDMSIIDVNSRRNVLTIATGRGPHSIVVDH